MGLIKEGKNSTILLDVCICMKSNLLGEKLSKEPPFLLTNETLFDWRLMCYKQSPSPSFLQNRIWLRCHWVDHLWQDCYLQPQIPVSLANLKFLSLYPSFSSIIGWEGSPRKNVVLSLFFKNIQWKGASTVALFDISIWHIDCRYIDTFEKYRYRYRYGHFWKYRYRYRYR